MDITEALPPAPPYAIAGSLLEALAARDFDRLTAMLDDAAALCALLPGEFGSGTERPKSAPSSRGGLVTSSFLDLIDASLGQVGRRLELRWRRHRPDKRLGSGRLTEPGASDGRHDGDHRSRALRTGDESPAH
jgi:hypothetical protein